MNNAVVYNGVSLFNSLAGAQAKIPVIERGGNTVLGIAELRIPLDSGIEIEKTLGRGHFTVTGSPEEILSFWSLTIFKP